MTTRHHCRTKNRQTNLVTKSVPLLAVLLMAGCGGGGASAGRPSTGVDQTKLVEAANCMRAHGFPDFPDPIEDHGTWVIPAPASELTPPPVCLDLFRAVKGAPPPRELSAAQMAQRRHWADCIRKNGIPGVPDPDGNGDFQLPPELTPITNQPNWLKARAACRSLEWPGVSFDK
jgi:hypothetical protein